MGNGPAYDHVIKANSNATTGKKVVEGKLRNHTTAYEITRKS